MYNEYDRCWDVEGRENVQMVQPICGAVLSLRVPTNPMKVIKCNNRYQMSSDFLLWELPTRGLHLFLGATLLIADK
jgi:hypothetical protein